MPVTISGNGSSITRAGITSSVTTMELRESCAEVDCTTLTSTLKVYEPGLPERTIAATVMGAGADAVLVPGSAGVVTSCTFGGATAEPSGLKFIVTKNDRDNGVDGAITASVTLVQTTT